MNPEIKAAIEREAEGYGEMVMKNNHVMWEGSIPNAFIAGAEYGYKLGLMVGRLRSADNKFLMFELKNEIQELLDEK